MNLEQMKKIVNGTPSGANHIDKSGDYWKIVGDKEAYFYGTLYNEWVRYDFDHNEDIKSGYIKPL